MAGAGWERGPALARIFARYLYAVIQRLNQAPEKNKLAFLDTLGLSLVPAQAARAPIVFELSAERRRHPGARRYATRRTAASGEERADYFRDRARTGLGAANLSQVVTLWPGRDQYPDHTAALAAERICSALPKPALLDTPHELYLAHEKLLALAGSVTVEVEVELTQVSSEAPEPANWQYRDGKLWRSFKSVDRLAGKEAANADSTNGFQSKWPIHARG